MIPRVTRRLVDSERKMITSGSVFVFDEDESGIKRWTDGFFWSPSRILGNFLLYRETEKRGAGHRGARNDADQVDQSGAADGAKSEGQTLSRPRGETTRLGIDRQRERSLVGSLTNSYKFKAGGMMKKVRLGFCMKSPCSIPFVSLVAAGRPLSFAPLSRDVLELHSPFPAYPTPLWNMPNVMSPGLGTSDLLRCSLVILSVT